MRVTLLEKLQISNLLFGEGLLKTFYFFNYLISICFTNFKIKIFSLPPAVPLVSRFITQLSLYKKLFEAFKRFRRVMHLAIGFSCYINGNEVCLLCRGHLEKRLNCITLFCKVKSQIEI